MRTETIEVKVFTAERPTAAMFATVELAKLGEWLERAYGAVAGYLSRYGVGPVGPPYARYHRLSSGKIEVEAGFEASTPVAGEGEVEPSSLPAGKAASAFHVGPPEEVSETYERLAAWIRSRGTSPADGAWVVYLTDPAQEPDHGKWRTEVLMPFG